MALLATSKSWPADDRWTESIQPGMSGVLFPDESNKEVEQVDTAAHGRSHEAARLADLEAESR